MATLTPLPRTAPPHELAERLQKSSNRILRAALQAPQAPSDSRVLECLGVALNLKARQSLESMGTAPLDADHYLPLRLAERLAPTTSLPFSMILDLILAYPSSLPLVHRVVDECIKRDNSLVPTFSKKVINPLFRILTAENRRITPPTKQPSRAAESDKRSQHPFARVSYTLLLLARAHRALADSVLGTDSSLEILRSSYAKIQETSALTDVAKVHTKQSFLILLHTLLSNLQQTEREWKLVNIQGEEDDRVRRVLKDANLEEDYRFFFVDSTGPEGQKEDEQKKPVLGEVEMDILRSLTMGDVNPTERGHAQEARIAPIKAVLPTVPSYLLISALSHPQFNLPLAADGSDPGVEALTNAILDNTLPPGLEKLQRAMSGEDTETASPPSTAQQTESPPTPEVPVSSGAQQPAKMPKRQNIWDNMPMDFEKLKVENERREASLEDAFSNIPDQLRDQILRLEELQHEEAEAERLAEREERDARRIRAEAARLAVEGGGKASRGVLQRPKTAAFEEELEEDDETEARDRIAMRGVTGDSEGSDDGEAVVAPHEDGSDSEIMENLDEAPDETYLELLYLHNRDAFNKDSTTRKSQKRAEMRSVMGWTDERLEDWAKLMDRNPRKAQILGRHAYTRVQNDLPSSSTSREDGSNRQRGGRGGGRGGSRGGAGGEANRGGRGGGGTGGQRGRGQNKSSRGHQNAARTRGHDKKMQKAAGWT